MTKKKKITENTHHCENCEGKEDYDNSEVMGALEPFFEIVQNEYNRERDRKQGLETRGGIAVTILIAIYAFHLKELEIASLIKLMHMPLTFITLIKILIGISVYASSILSIWFSFKVLSTSDYSFFDISGITTARLEDSKSREMYDIIMLYKETVEDNRKANNKKASNLEYLMISVLACIICTYLFIQLGV